MKKYIIEANFTDWTFKANAVELTVLQLLRYVFVQLALQLEAEGEELLG